MSIRKVVAGLLIAAGIAIMAVPFFWRTTGEKQTEQLISEFEQTLEDDYDEETDVEEEQTSISKEDEAILKEGGVIGIIEIPGLDIRYPVMEGTTSKVLNAGIGHIEETAGIGESGNCVLCGHNGSRYGTFFTPLSQISIGDEVMITDKNGLKHIYEVRVRYNVMLSEGENTYANDEWSRLLPDIRHNATVDLDAVFGELQLINPRAKSFLCGIQAAFMASDTHMADELIRKRERSLKGAARAKLSRTKEFDHSKWVGGGMLDYRFSNARRIVNDIYAGEVSADV